MQTIKQGIWSACRFVGGVFFAVTLAACGSGGGGGGGSGSSSNNGGSSQVSYTGVTTQAAVISANADDLSGGAVLGGGAGAATSLIGVAANEASTPAKMRSVVASTALKKSLARMDFTANGISVIAGAMVPHSDTILGACGGNAPYSVALDDVTGDFSGTISFNGYCDDGDTLTGSVNFSGNMNLGTSDFTAFNLSASSLAVVSGADNFTIAGSIASTGITPNSENLLITLDIRDGTGTTYRIQDFKCAMTYDSPSVGTDRMHVISGRFYHPAYGYVDVASTSDFLSLSTSDYPYSGVLVVIGGSGTRAQLTANSDAQTFTVVVDTNGNAIYDEPGTIYRWDSL